MLEIEIEERDRANLWSLEDKPLYETKLEMGWDSHDLLTFHRAIGNSLGLLDSRVDLGEGYEIGGDDWTLFFLLT